MLDCCRRKRSIPIHELAFLTLCENSILTKDAKTTERLELIWNDAEDKKQTLHQIILAGKSRGTSPLHILAKNGNATVLEWYLDKRKWIW